MRILLTGCAGFIGSHTLNRLLADGHSVVGIDNFDPFYSRLLKNANLSAHIGNANFELIEANLEDASTYQKLRILLGNEPFNAIIHLAAKAGVRPSIQDPVGYQRANVIATQNLLEFAKENEIKQFVFASSSSVYGVNPNVPWRESDHVLQPISPYASTKVSCELMGHVYSRLYGIRVLGLRFFTVYGPRQRPDLAINKFVRLIEAGEQIPVFGDGSTRRDYTYIDDIVDGIIGSLHYVGSEFEVINLGNDQTVTLAAMIETIETTVGKKAIIDRQPEQPGDVPQTWADVSHAKELLGYKPMTSFAEGVSKFYDWWKASELV
ncbi:MAG: GDP-mannose 4,6-dehydratase [Verrucomicrobiota bacterium]